MYATNGICKTIMSFIHSYITINKSPSTVIQFKNICLNTIAFQYYSALAVPMQAFILKQTHYPQKKLFLNSFAERIAFFTVE